MKKMTLTFECPDEVEGMEIFDTLDRVKDVLQDGVDAVQIKAEYLGQVVWFV